ncbi:MAG: phosphatase PAP2 family protein [Candidatus Bathyarchaeia archaeon]
MNTTDNSLTNQRVLILISVLSIACFLPLTFWHNPFFGLNQPVNLWAANLQLGNEFTQAANLVSKLFDTTVLLACSLPIAAVLFYKKYKADALLLVGVMGVDAIALSIIKSFVVSPRPLNGLVFEDGSSFPSGHVTTTIVLFGLLTFFVWQTLKSVRPKIAMAALTLALTVAVGFDRIYLNVHWLSDVLAAPFLALFILATSLLIMQCLTGWYNKRHNAVFRGDSTV